MSHMKVADLLKTMFPNPTPAEIAEVAKYFNLGATADTQTPCEARGHKFKPLDRLTVAVGWFGRTKTVSRTFCEKCGLVRTYPV